MSSGILQFRSWGFELFVPPTPFAVPTKFVNSPTLGRFVMLDDLNDVFYDVDYVTTRLGNETAWEEIALHKVSNPAIVFPPEQQDMLQIMNFATGLLVSIESWETSIINAHSLGRVNVKPLPREFMSWGALKGVKGPELPAEMRAGLLRRVWNRNPESADFLDVPFVTPNIKLDTMPRRWHEDGVTLNHELDERFVGARMHKPPSRWRISGLSEQQIEVSRARASSSIDD